MPVIQRRFRSQLQNLLPHLFTAIPSPFLLFSPHLPGSPRFSIPFPKRKLHPAPKSSIILIDANIKECNQRKTPGRDIVAKITCSRCQVEAGEDLKGWTHCPSCGERYCPSCTEQIQKQQAPDDVRYIELTPRCPQCSTEMAWTT